MVAEVGIEDVVGEGEGEEGGGEGREAERHSGVFGTWAKRLDAGYDFARACVLHETLKCDGRGRTKKPCGRLSCTGEPRTLARAPSRTGPEIAGPMN
jgi:hypothetical protein